MAEERPGTHYDAERRNQDGDRLRDPTPTLPDRAVPIKWGTIGPRPREGDRRAHRLFRLLQRHLRRHDARGPGRCRGRPRAIQAAVASLGLPCELTFETVRRGGFRATLRPGRRAARARPSPPAPHRGDDRQERAHPPPERAGQADLPPARRGRGGGARDRHRRRSTSTRSARSTRSSTSSARPSGSTCSASSGSRPARSRPGRGWVKAAHGKMPLPAPATAELLKGVPLAESTVEMELTTPTGAAIVTTVAEAFGPLPADDDRGDRPGGRDARICPARRTSSASSSARSPCRPTADRVWVLETNLDDLPGEVVGYTTTQLMAAGALDAFVTPIQMKKNRPGVMVTVLCDEAKIPAMEEILFRETTTLGIRRYPVSRHKLKRQAAEVDDPVRDREGEARLARRPAADVQPRARRLRPGRRASRASRSATSTTPPTPPIAARPGRPSRAGRVARARPRPSPRPLDHEHEHPHSDSSRARLDQARTSIVPGKDAVDDPDPSADPDGRRVPGDRRWPRPASAVAALARRPVAAVAEIARLVDDSGAAAAMRSRRCCDAALEAERDDRWAGCGRRGRRARGTRARPARSSGRPRPSRRPSPARR